MQLSISLIRAGKGEGEVSGQVPALQDKPLEAGEQERLHLRAQGGALPPAAILYTSPFLRCRETAFALYPRIPAILVSQFGQFDAGLFAGKTQRELAALPQFREWAKRDEVSSCPQGGNLYAYAAFCARAFRDAAEEMASKGIEHAAIITHGLTIRLLMQRFCIPRALYRSYHAPHGGGYELCFDSRQSSAYIVRDL